MLSRSAHRPQRLRLTLRLLAVAGATAGLAAALSAADASAASRGSVARNEITGTVRLYGCVPDATKLSLVATPLGFAAPDAPRTLGGTAPIRAARLLTTGDTQVLAFSLRSLRKATLYRLGITYPDASCGKVFWRGPADGLVSPGEERVQIEGFAARTTIEVREEGADRWLAGDDLRLMDSRHPAEREFRWRSTLPAVVGGELQVAIDPFPTEGAFDPCAEPGGAIVYRQPVDASDGVWVDIGMLDLSAILNPEPRDVVAGVSPISRGTYRSLLAGRPIYVRVVPETADGPACNLVDDGVSSWVLLGNVPDTHQEALPVIPSNLAPGDGNQYLPPYTLDRPAYGEHAFKVIKDHKLPAKDDCGFAGFAFDPLGCTIVLSKWQAPGTVIEKGKWFVLPPAKSSGGGGFDPLAAVGSFTSALYTMTAGELSALGTLVDGASKLWAEIKKQVVKAVVSVIQTLPFGQQGCDAIAKIKLTSCESIVEAGLTIALASAGIPPSLPNWEELKEQGIKYAAAEIATQIADETGGIVPAEITQPMLEQMAKAALDKMTENRGGSDSKSDWVIPYLGFDPATMVVSIQKTTVEPSSEDLHLYWPETPLFRGGYLPLPRVFPDDGALKIPVVLEPNLSGFKAPICTWNLYTRTATCLPLLPPGSAPECLGRSGPKPNDPWTPFDCKNVNYPQIYYRDRWANEHVDAVSCTAIAATTLSLEIKTNPNNPFDIYGEVSPAPLDWRYTMFAAVKPRLGATWNGPTYFGC
jgi:hypothetical protein